MIFTTVISVISKIKFKIMTKGRLEAFSDGVLAIIITIMVLELRAPHGSDIFDLLPIFPKFASYILSFIYIGIYWNNHHHLLHTAQNINGGILWSNLHLLFWLSLIPFTTSWIGETNFVSFPMALYGFVLLMSAISYFILQQRIIHRHGIDSALSKAVGKDYKGKISLILYVFAIPLAFVFVWAAGAIYIIVAGIWLIPDKRIEKQLSKSKD